MRIHRRARRGWVLFEMMVAFTIFIITAAAVLGAVSQAVTAAERTRDRTKAVDIARSAMAKLEAGLGTAQTLAGPLMPWEPTIDPDAPFDETADFGFSEIAPLPSPWEVEIDTIPSRFPGLTHVIVTATKRPSPESDRIIASYALHQLVRMAPDIEDTVGEIDDMAIGGGS
jgi:type II secretory pathway pseudopilin PulG